MTAEPDTPPPPSRPAPPIATSAQASADVERKALSPAVPSPGSNTNVHADPESLTLAELWSRVMEAVERMPSISVATEPMRPVERQGSTLRLSAPERSAKMFTEFQRSKLEEEIERVFGSPLRVELVAERASETTAPEATAREVDASARARAMQHPVVRKATELFDARIIRVDPPES